jgi:uncharacterized membrane-anchored protein
VAITAVGTVISDFIDRRLHVGLVLSSTLLLAPVVALLLGWRATTGRIAAGRITSRTDAVCHGQTIAAAPSPVHRARADRIERSTRGLPYPRRIPRSGDTFRISRPEW